MSNGKLMIWTIPRSKSTIISKSISSNKDIYCFFEPFFFKYVNKICLADLEIAINKDFFSREGPAICKDQPVYLEHNFEKWIGDTDVRHAILIRNPTEVALSTIIVDGKKIPFMESNHGVTLEDHWRALKEIKTFLEKSGKTMKIFDSSDLNSDTCEHFMKSLCEFGGIDFDATKMLKMPCYEEFPDNWWVPSSANALIQDEKNGATVDLYGSALSSTSFRSHKSSVTRENITSNQLKRLDALLEVCQPIYNHFRSC